MIVTCKDGRRLKFALNNEKKSRIQIFESLHKFAFPLSNSLVSNLYSSPNERPIFVPTFRKKIVQQNLVAYPFPYTETSYATMPIPAYH